MKPFPVQLDFDIGSILRVAPVEQEIMAHFAIHHCQEYIRLVYLI